MLMWVCSVKDRRIHQNVVTTSVTHSAELRLVATSFPGPHPQLGAKAWERGWPRGPLLCSQHV